MDEPTHSAQPNPFSDPTLANPREGELHHGLPEMSRTEASLHETVAGQRASAEAKKQGCNPEALEALGRATCGPTQIGGFSLKPAGEGTFITLRKCARMFEEYATAAGMPVSTDEENPGSRELYELGLATMIFTDSRRVFRDLEAGKLPQLMEEAMDIIFDTSLEVQQQLKNHIEDQMEEINRLSGGGEVHQPGKR